MPDVRLDRFAWTDDSPFGLVSPCSACVHQETEASALASGLPAACRAFPLGIPREIQDGDDLHREPRPDDRGFQYLEGAATWTAPPTSEERAELYGPTPEDDPDA